MVGIIVLTTEMCTAQSDSESVTLLAMWEAEARVWQAQAVWAGV